MMSARRYLLRRRCRLALAAVTIPVPWDLRTFLAQLAQQRGRQIFLVETDKFDGTTVSAQWFKFPDFDVIFHAPTQSVFYLEVSVLHEVGHMLRNHDHKACGKPLSVGDLGAMTAAPGAAAIMFSDGASSQSPPESDEEMAARVSRLGGEAMVFSRSSRCDSVEEQEAEYTAYVLKLRIERGGHIVGDWDPETAHIRTAMRRTLGGATP